MKVDTSKIKFIFKPKSKEIKTKIHKNLFQFCLRFLNNETCYGWDGNNFKLIELKKLKLDLNDNKYRDKIIKFINVTN